MQMQDGVSVWLTRFYRQTTPAPHTKAGLKSGITEENESDVV